MCQDAKTPHLRTFTLLLTDPVTELTYRELARAQGFRWGDTHVDLWRRIEGGDEQIVASFRREEVRGVFEDASTTMPDGSLTVPEGWSRDQGSPKTTTPPPPSDDDVPF